MNFTVENKPTYPTAPARVSKPATPVSAKSLENKPSAQAKDTYTPGTSALQTDVLALRRYASQQGTGTNQGLPNGWQHSVNSQGQSSYNNTSADNDPAFRVKVTRRPAKTAPAVKPRQRSTSAAPQAHGSTPTVRPSLPGRIPQNSRFATAAKPAGSEANLQTGAVSASAAPRRAPRSKAVQLDLVDKVYTKTAGARMEKSSNERICLWYAKDIYNGLMDQKEAGKLPDFQPRIYGWEKPADAQFGELALKRGAQEAKNYAHNLAVLEDKEGNVVKVLDPWETGFMWTDSLTTFNSVEEYKEARGDKGWRVGDLSGKLVPWPVEDEQHARKFR